ncbi:MAG: MbcA/ParS/Xre antitoxin family protein [Acidobacteriia bacterium]|nr:MbcA/ParS/Xre antitoxin family protein [Terriglobia bacterium]
MQTLAVIAPEIWRHALDTFSTEERALRWMRQSLAELGNLTPENVLLEDPRSNAVEAILERIDYGVYPPTLTLEAFRREQQKQAGAQPLTPDSFMESLRKQSAPVTKEPPRVLPPPPKP